MKKLFSLSFVFFAFASQASVSAQSLPGDPTPPEQLVDNLCLQIEQLDIEDDEDTIALVETGNPKLEMKWSFFDVTEDSFQWKSEIKIRGTNDWFTNYHMELIRIK